MNSLGFFLPLSRSTGYLKVLSTSEATILRPFWPKDFASKIDVKMDCGMDRDWAAFLEFKILCLESTIFLNNLQLMVLNKAEAALRNTALEYFHKIQCSYCKALRQNTKSRQSHFLEANSCWAWELRQRYDDTIQLEQHICPVRLKYHNKKQIRGNCLREIKGRKKIKTFVHFFRSVICTNTLTKKWYKPKTRVYMHVTSYIQTRSVQSRAVTIYPLVTFDNQLL